jgi:hypothetical protein
MGADAYADQQRFLRRLRQQRELVVWTGRMAQADGVWHEKGVDVKIATDMVSLAYRDLYDAAILVSGDSDLAPAVQEIRPAASWKMPSHEPGVRGILSAKAPGTFRSTWSSLTAAGFHKETCHGLAASRYIQRDRHAEAPRDRHRVQAHTDYHTGREPLRRPFLSR